MSDFAFSPSRRRARPRPALSLWAGAGLAAELPAQRQEMQVFAAASLADALAEVGRRWEAAAGQHPVFNFGASSDLSRQIRAGAPADVFFSADSAQMDALEKEGLVRAADRLDLLSNTLVVIVPVALDGACRRPRATSRRSRRSPLADPQAVPAGVYAGLAREPRALAADRAARGADARRARGARRRRVRATSRPASSTGPTRRVRSAPGSRSRCRASRGRDPLSGGAARPLGAAAGRRVRRVPALARRSRRSSRATASWCSEAGSLLTRGRARDRRLQPRDGRGRDAPDPAARRAGGARARPLPGPGQGRRRDAAVAAAGAAADRGRPAAARGARPARAARRLPRAPRDRGGLHLEGGRARDGGDVVPAAGALGAHRLRGGRPAPRRHRAHARLRARWRLSTA